VAPGIVDTDLTHQVLGDSGILELEKQIPVGRLGKPEEIAALVSWLASSENSYVSGQNISIDGGLSRV
jgi:NAD(P)-dependent dehydrogenase (short-subunit alcohol dehydrogenase family)